MIREDTYNYIKELLSKGKVRDAESASHNDLELKRVHTSKTYEQYRRFASTGLLEGEEYDLLPTQRAVKAEPTDMYITRDTDMAAVLMAKGIELEDYRRVDNATFFVFKDLDKCNKYERENLVSGVLVNSNKFVSSKTQLKNIIFGAKG